jgi:hypothetical protein
MFSLDNTTLESLHIQIIRKALNKLVSYLCLSQVFMQVLKHVIL